MTDAMRNQAHTHAASLRTLKVLCGIAFHPQFHEVYAAHGFDPVAQKNNLRVAILELYHSCPLLWVDLLGYARAGKRDTFVLLREGKLPTVRMRGDE